MIKTDLILAGVGGQGILSIASAIGLAALEEGMSIKQAEVHGMSQRGGAVQSHLRFSDQQVFSDLIPQGQADLVISVEPMEALRYLPWLSQEGWLVANAEPFINIPNYPPLDELMIEIKKFEKHILINTDSIAREIGSAKASNMVILGAAAARLNLKIVSLENAIRKLFITKGEEIVALNLSAFHAGLIHATNNS